MGKSMLTQLLKAQEIATLMGHKLPPGSSMKAGESIVMRCLFLVTPMENPKNGGLIGCNGDYRGLINKKQGC